jgi:hypothetical protein
MQEQHGQERALLAAAEHDGLTPLEGLKWAEDAEVHERAAGAWRSTRTYRSPAGA